MNETTQDVHTLLAQALEAEAAYTQAREKLERAQKALGSARLRVHAEGGDDIGLRFRLGTVLTSPGGGRFVVGMSNWNGRPYLFRLTKNGSISKAGGHRSYDRDDSFTAQFKITEGGPR